MLLTLDIGNTAMKFGVFEGDELIKKFVVPTDADDVPADMSRAIGENVDGKPDGVMISSVVPEFDDVVYELFLRSGIAARQIKPTDDFGLTIGFPVDSFGTDRLVNSFAAVEKHGAPCVVVSFGTATTIDVVNKDREYLGGLIAPGPRVNAKALEQITSKLPLVEVVDQPNVINANTTSAIQAGIFYSQIGLIDAVIPHIKAEIGQDAKVIATGGFAPLFADKCRFIDIGEPDLTLHGLKMLYSRA